MLSIRGILIATGLLAALAHSRSGKVCTLHAPSQGGNVTQQLRELLGRCSGGTVVVPAGDFITGPVNISSHTTLELQRGALLRGSPLKADFPKLPAPPSYGVSRDDRSVPPYTRMRYHPLIFAANATDVHICGEGTIDGNGALWMAMRETADLDAGRPRLVELYEVKHAVIEGITLRNSAFWTVHLLYSDDVHVKGITIENSKEFDNNDGVDPDSSTNVLIENCNITCGDDAIAIKSGWDAMGIATARPTRNVTVKNCIFDAENGVSIGSEISGGVEKVHVENITMAAFHRALYVKTATTRGGYVRDVSVSNVHIIETMEAIAVLRNYSDPNPTNPHGFKPPPTQIGDLRFDHIWGNAQAAAGQLIGDKDAPLTVDFNSVEIDGAAAGFLCAGPVNGSAWNVTPPVCFGDIDVVV